MNQTVRSIYEIKEAKRVQEKLRIYVEVKPWLANDNQEINKTAWL